MSFYLQVIFPRLCDLFLNRSFVARHRQELLSYAHGNVLEIGFGTGLNLPHYPVPVRKITAADPNRGVNRLAQRRVKKTWIEVDQRIISGERFPFEEGAFDSVVSTFTLCSIKNMRQAVSELYRVLKPGCLILFLEHGLSPEPSVQKWQRRLNWLHGRLSHPILIQRPHEDTLSPRLAIGSRRRQTDLPGPTRPRGRQPEAARR